MVRARLLSGVALKQAHMGCPQPTVIGTAIAYETEGMELFGFTEVVEPVQHIL